MEEMRQSHCGECCEGIRTVQGVVHPLTAPPPRSNYSREGMRKRWEKKERTSEFRNQCILYLDLCGVHFVLFI